MSYVERYQIHEHRIDGKRLGRHVRHDPKSFEFPAPMAARLQSVRHNRLVPIFDQGDLGSCTGNAAIGCISTDPFKFHGTEKDAVDVYAAATRLDSILGHYPPDDTGSSSLAVMKVLKQRKQISGYSWGFGLDHALRALVLRPGITGISWRTGCDEPDIDGMVRYTGAVRGGHEIQLVGLDVDKQVVWFANSWGPSWGKNGYFGMLFSDYGKALANLGDVVFPAVP